MNRVFGALALLALSGCAQTPKAVATAPAAPEPVLAPPRQLAPVATAGQPDIGEQQIDLRMGVEQGQRGGGVAGGEHPVAEFRDHAFGIGAHVGIVLDDQHGFLGPPARRRRRWLSRPSPAGAAGTA